MRVTINPQTIDVTGLALVYAEATSTEYQFANWGNGKDVIVAIQNEGTSNCNATFVTPWAGHSVANLALGDTTVGIPASGRRFISDFSPSLFNQRGVGESLGSQGFVYLDLETTENISVAIMKVRE